jgi:hypothetical protein
MFRIYWHGLSKEDQEGHFARTSSSKVPQAQTMSKFQTILVISSSSKERILRALIWIKTEGIASRNTRTWTHWDVS